MQIKVDPETGGVTVDMSNSEAWGLRTALEYLSCQPAGWSDMYEEGAVPTPDGVDLEEATEGVDNLQRQLPRIG